MKKVSPRQRRKYRIRRSISGVEDCPRLSVFRSDRYTTAQIVVDNVGVGSAQTLLSASTRDEDIKRKAADYVADGGSSSSKSVAAAKALGAMIAEKCKEKSITKLKFDRNGFIYHGRIQAVADGIRDGGVTI